MGRLDGSLPLNQNDSKARGAELGMCPWDIPSSSLATLRKSERGVGEVGRGHLYILGRCIGDGVVLHRAGLFRARYSSEGHTML